jgi:hypothetical protein
MNIYIVTFYPDLLGGAFGGRALEKRILAVNKPAALREARASYPLEVASITFVSTLAGHLDRLQDYAEQLSRNSSVPAHLVNEAWAEHDRARALLAS